jgi:hypothetical protein
MALRSGAYTVSVDVEWSGLDEPGTPVAVLDVAAGDEVVGSSVLAPATAAGTATLTCPFELDDLRFAVHARLRGTGAASLRTPMTLHMDPDPYGVDRAG